MEFGKYKIQEYADLMGSDENTETITRPARESFDKIPKELMPDNDDEPGNRQETIPEPSPVPSLSDEERKEKYTKLAIAYGLDQKFLRKLNLKNWQKACDEIDAEISKVRLNESAGIFSKVFTWIIETVAIIPAKWRNRYSGLSVRLDNDPEFNEAFKRVYAKHQANEKIRTITEKSEEINLARVVAKNMIAMQSHELQHKETTPLNISQNEN